MRNGAAGGTVARGSVAAGSSPGSEAAAEGSTTATTSPGNNGENRSPEGGPLLKKQKKRGRKSKGTVSLELKQYETDYMRYYERVKIARSKESEWGWYKALIDNVKEFQKEAGGGMDCGGQVGGGAGGMALPEKRMPEGITEMIRYEIADYKGLSGLTHYAV